MKKILLLSLCFFWALSFNLSNVFAEDESDLQLSVSEDEVVQGEAISIYFNDIGSDYYVLEASCKDSVLVDTKIQNAL